MDISKFSPFTHLQQLRHVPILFYEIITLSILRINGSERDECGDAVLGSISEGQR